MVFHGYDANGFLFYVHGCTWCISAATWLGDIFQMRKTFYISLQSLPAMCQGPDWNDAKSSRAPHLRRCARETPQLVTQLVRKALCSTPALLDSTSRMRSGVAARGRAMGLSSLRRGSLKDSGSPAKRMDEEWYTSRTASQDLLSSCWHVYAGVFSLGLSLHDQI